MFNFASAGDIENAVSDSLVTSTGSIVSVVSDNLWPIFEIVGGILAIILVASILLAMLSDEKFNKI